jgi:anhydro-N-acetylmuramic acid kinase
MDALARYAALPERLVIGLMSGTSADGIDAALCRLSKGDGPDRVSLVAFRCYPFPPEIRARLLALFDPAAPVAEACRMNVVLGRLFGEAACELMRETQAASVDLIASHGQTICHLPGDAATLQIGEPAVIAELTGTMVVADFRPADMAAGGQGAPLVPYADYLLFQDATKTRAIQNLGGIGNVTVLPAGGGIDDLIAFDTGPGNMVIDALITVLSGGELSYDRDGVWAARGEVQPGLLHALMQHAFLRQPPPKSTGGEEFGAAFAAELLARAAREGIGPDDLVATATAFTAASIASAYRQFVLPKHRVDEVILGGGGSYNPTLRRMLEERLPGVRVLTHEEVGLNGEAKEALAFALLGNETVLGRPSNVPAATGARRPVVLGKIVLPPAPRGDRGE